MAPAALVVYVCSDEDAHDSRQRLRRVGLDPVDLCMRIGAAEDRGMEHAWQRQVIHVSGDAFNQAGSSTRS